MSAAGLGIDIIAVGKLKEQFWTQACDEYSKRLSRYAKLNIIQVPDQPARTDADVRKALALEAQAILAKLPDNTSMIALDSNGRQFSSDGLAAHLAGMMGQGTSRLAFVIGGSWGLDASVKQRAGMLLSFGAITLPHNLARVVLLEQIYRCFRILNGQRYHK